MLPFAVVFVLVIYMRLLVLVNIEGSWRRQRQATLQHGAVLAWTCPCVRTRTLWYMSSCNSSAASCLGLAGGLCLCIQFGSPLVLLSGGRGRMVVLCMDLLVCRTGVNMVLRMAAARVACIRMPLRLCLPVGRIGYQILRLCAWWSGKAILPGMPLPSAICEALKRVPFSGAESETIQVSPHSGVTRRWSHNVGLFSGFIRGP